MTETPARTYTVILDWLEDQLRRGEIGVGDKLPGERILAERFGISRPSVREATRVLDAMGLIRTSTGSGPNSGAIVISEPSAALAWALRMHVATRALPVGDIVKARILLETEAARVGARREEVPERLDILARAAELLDLMDEPDLPTESFHRLDAEFHVLLSSLGGNVVLETMMTSLREATIGYVQETVARIEDWGAVRDTLQHQHRSILRSVSDGDGDSAAHALAEHIRWFYGIAEEKIPERI